MALIKCSECDNEVSTKAQSCPHCGAPVVAEPPALPQQEDPSTLPVPSSSETAPDWQHGYGPEPWTTTGWWGTTSGRKAASAFQEAQRRAVRALTQDEGLQVLQALFETPSGEKFVIPDFAPAPVAPAPQLAPEAPPKEDEKKPKREIPIFWIVVAALVVLFVIPSVWGPPISIQFRRGMLGKVMLLTNTSDKTLRVVTVKAYNARTHEKRNEVVALTLEPHRTIEFGWTDDWIWLSGEKFAVSAKGYVGDITGYAP